MAFLDENGLSHLWEKIKGKFVVKVSGKQLSTNDYTTEEKAKLSGIEQGAEVNVIEKISRNGTALSIKEKEVNIQVPTKVSELSDAGNYALKNDIVGMYRYKGSVVNSAALPATGQKVGDVYNIETESVYGGAGMNVAWDGSKWDPLGEIFKIDAITNTQIDQICN